MTRVDFYILKPGSQSDRNQLACRIAEKAWSSGHRVLIQARDRAHLQHLDSLLWTFREQSFLPHGELGKADPPLNPILLNCEATPGDEHDVLINLSSDIPEWFSRFERVSECIDQQPEVRSRGRERFRFYKDHGYPVYDHKI